MSIDENEIVFRNSQKNKPMVIYQNYVYQKDNEKGSTSYWCCENKNKGCPARIILFNNQFKTANKKIHNHSAVVFKNGKVKYKHKKELIVNVPVDCHHETHTNCHCSKVILYNSYSIEIIHEIIM